MGDQTALPLQFVSFTVLLHLEEVMRANYVGVPRHVSNRERLLRSSLDLFGFLFGNSFVKRTSEQRTAYSIP